MSTPRFITTPSGVRIGCAYQRPAPRLDRDHLRVQAALLEPRTARPIRAAQRVLAAIVGWL